jgi:ectoine hydroxylase-related dioxygenase (phytanoyl-CoA dioxygenase family)
MLQDEAERLAQDKALLAERGAILNGVARADRLDPVIDLSPPFARLAEDPRILALSAEAVGGPPQLFKDKLIFKPPGAIGYAAHQDAPYWPGWEARADALVTLAIFLDRAADDNGTIECLSGGHRELLTEPGRIADLDERSLDPFTPIRAEPGDVLLLHALVPHRSSANHSRATRRILFLTYGHDPQPDLYRRYQRTRMRSPR